ncbi:MAG: DUF5324 family protein [Nocardioidaceae bacterium]
MHRRSKQTGAKKFADQARKQMAPHVKEARKQLEPHLKDARKNIEPHVKDAREKLEPYFDEALERLLPYVEEARTQANEKLIPAAEQAAKEAHQRFHDDVVPSLAAAVAHATEVSEPYREEAKKRGAAAMLAMKGELEAPAPKKKSHKLRKLVLLLGLGGAAAYGYKKLTSNDDAAWQSSYEPTPAPPTAGPRPTPVPDPTGDDAAAAAPDEALADADETPHSPTDPDNPVEKKDIG